MTHNIRPGYISAIVICFIIFFTFGSSVSPQRRCLRNYVWKLLPRLRGNRLKTWLLCWLPGYYKVNLPIPWIRSLFTPIIMPETYIILSIISSSHYDVIDILVKYISSITQQHVHNTNNFFIRRYRHRESMKILIAPGDICPLLWLRAYVRDFFKHPPKVSVQPWAFQSRLATNLTAVNNSSKYIFKRYKRLQNGFQLVYFSFIGHQFL